MADAEADAGFDVDGSDIIIVTTYKLTQNNNNYNLVTTINFGTLLFWITSLAQLSNTLVGCSHTTDSKRLLIRLTVSPAVFKFVS